MTMHDPNHDPRASADPVGWMQDQMVQVKAQLGRLTQATDQTQAGVLDVNEKMRDTEAKVREMTARTLGLPGMAEQLRQLTGLRRIGLSLGERLAFLEGASWPCSAGWAAVAY